MLTERSWSTTPYFSTSNDGTVTVDTGDLTGVVLGDTLVVPLYIRGASSTSTPPAGWNTLDSVFHARASMYLFTRTADADDVAGTATHAFTTSGSTRARGYLGAYLDLNPTTLETSDTDDSNTATVSTLSTSVTSTSATTLMISFQGFESNISTLVTADSDFVLKVDTGGDQSAAAVSTRLSTVAETVNDDPTWVTPARSTGVLWVVPETSVASTPKRRHPMRRVGIDQSFRIRRRESGRLS